MTKKSKKVIRKLQSRKKLMEQSKKNQTKLDKIKRL